MKKAVATIPSERSLIKLVLLIDRSEYSTTLLYTQKSGKLRTAFNYRPPHRREWIAMQRTSLQAKKEETYTSR